ncbi:MAG: penicillin-binding transpeptidase domain-containing protein [Erysipelotrichaceae bacterium]
MKAKVLNVKKANIKIFKIFIVVIIIGIVIISNVFYTIVFGTHFRSGVDILEYKNGSDMVQQPIKAQRGYIYDRNGNIIAQDIDTYNIILYLDKERLGINNVPAYVVDKNDTAKKLAPILEMKEEDIMLQLNQEGKYQCELGSKGKNLTSDKKDKIDALKLPGIDYVKNSTRVYPYGKFASHLVGFATYEEAKKEDKDKVSGITGRMGLEKYLNKELTGTDGLKTYQKTAGNTVLPGTEKIVSKESDGDNVYLTIDKDIQLALEGALQKTIDKNGASKAWGVIVEVKTGKILGWAGNPTFDLNEREIDSYVDLPSSYAFECGSVMKPFTYAAAMDAGVYKGKDTFVSGTYHVGLDANGKIIRLNDRNGQIAEVSDALGHQWGSISYDEGLIRSSNTGIVSLFENQLNFETFGSYLDKFGFFKKVGIEGIDESTGTKVFEWPIEKVTTGFGQGSTVTTLQLLQAYSSIFNKGTMIQPYVIDRIENGNTHEIIRQSTTKEAGKPIKAETATQVMELMKQVVESDIGTGHSYQLNNGVSMLVKTGTGQIAGENGYNSNLWTSSVIAAAPADEPEIMMFYAFESSEIVNFSRDYFKEAFGEAVKVMNIQGNNEHSSNVDNDYEKWEEYKMPTLVNHTLEYANNKLDGMKINKVVIGDGKNVISQYPSYNSSIGTRSNLFLLSEGSNVKMPNMTGYSRKDVQIYANMTKIPITIEGSGLVASQSVATDSPITTSSKISVKLE